MSGTAATFSAFGALFRKELRGRGTLLAAALALGLLPFALPLLPQARGQSAADLRVVAAALLAAAGTTLLTLLLGAELLSRELAERRLGFYLSRPIQLGTLWAAKVAAAYAVLLAAVVCMLAPVLLFDRPAVPGDGPNPPQALVLLAALLLALLAASALAIFARARSPRLAFDVGGLLLASLLAGSAGLRLWRAGAEQGLGLGLGLFAAASLAALYAAHAAALEHGRNDLRRASSILSRRLWSLLLPAAGAFALFAAWTLAPRPSALREIWRIEPSPRGDWVGVSGRLTGRFDLEMMFLWHPASGRFFRLPEALPQRNLMPVAFSSAGGTAVWVEREDALWALWRLDLDAAAHGQAEPVRTTISFAALPSRLLLSPDGRLLASRGPARWLLEELRTGKLLASVDDDDLVTDARWMAEDRLRIFGLAGFDTPHVRARAWELTPATATPQPLFSVNAGRSATPLWISDLDGYALLRASPDGRRALARDEHGWRLLDAASGAVLADVAPFENRPDAGRRSVPLFLPDGRILARQSVGAVLILRLLDQDGRELGELRPAMRPRGYIGGLPTPGHLLLAELGSATESTRLLELDLADGTLIERGRGVLPLLAFGTEGLPPSGAAARWLADADTHALRYLNPDGAIVDPLHEP